MKIFECESCGAEIPTNKPESCPLCGKKNFVEYEKEVKKDKEDEKYKEKYDKVLKELHEYSEGTEPEDYRYSFAD